mmetsp:Transcript_8917/g.26609  ORF Transcript_8917/g.26609 Transcript_8917/m.26609 type:complete len:227 (-) Transcript_8917:357-1037(-)
MGGGLAPRQHGRAANLDILRRRGSGRSASDHGGGAVASRRHGAQFVLLGFEREPLQFRVVHTAASDFGDRQGCNSRQSDPSGDRVRVPRERVGRGHSGQVCTQDCIGASAQLLEQRRVNQLLTFCSGRECQGAPIVLPPIRGDDGFSTLASGSARLAGGTDQFALGKLALGYHGLEHCRQRAHLGGAAARFHVARSHACGRGGVERLRSVFHRHFLGGVLASPVGG